MSRAQRNFDFKVSMLNIAAMVRTVKIFDEDFHTMDDYQTDLSMDDHVTEDPWYGEDEVALGAVPNYLWRVLPLDKHPDAQEQWVDRLAC